MEIEEIILSIKSLDFDDVIKREARVYLTTGYKSVPYHDKNDDKKFITNGLKRFVNKSDKIIFLLEAINYLNEGLSEINEMIDHQPLKADARPYFSIRDLEHKQRNGELKISKQRKEAQIFYSVKELEKLGLNDLNKNAFSNTQVDDLTRKINALLIKIDELTVGQEIIYNFVDELKTDLNELKSDFPLGKKRWYQRFSGILAGYIGNKGADAFYDLIKPDLMKIIKEMPIKRFLQ